MYTGRKFRIRKGILEAFRIPKDSSEYGKKSLGLYGKKVSNTTREESLDTGSRDFIGILFYGKTF